MTFYRQKETPKVKKTVSKSFSLAAKSRKIAPPLFFAAKRQPKKQQACHDGQACLIIQPSFWGFNAVFAGLILQLSNFTLLVLFPYNPPCFLMILFR